MIDQPSRQLLAILARCANPCSAIDSFGGPGNMRQQTITAATVVDFKHHHCTNVAFRTQEKPLESLLFLELLVYTSPNRQFISPRKPCSSCRRHDLSCIPADKSIRPC